MYYLPQLAPKTVEDLQATQHVNEEALVLQLEKELEAKFAAVRDSAKSAPIVGRAPTGHQDVTPEMEEIEEEAEADDAELEELEQ